MGIVGFYASHQFSRHDLNMAMLVPYRWVLFLVFAKILLCFTIGAGLLKLKPWAWYLAAADQANAILILPSQGFLFGWQSYDPEHLFFTAAISVLALCLLFLPSIRAQFALDQNKFQIKSWYGRLIMCLLTISFAVPVASIGMKCYASVVWNVPFWAKTIGSLSLKEFSSPTPPAGFQRVSHFRLSFLVPEGFIVRKETPDGIYLGDPSGIRKGIIAVHPEPTVAEFHKLNKIFLDRDLYHLEEALYRNSWGVMPLMLRSIFIPWYGDSEIFRFETGQVKGFVNFHYWEQQKGFVYECSVYDKSNDEMGQVHLAFHSQSFSREDALKIIASIRVVGTGS